jgi:hypothetical protein
MRLSLCASVAILSQNSALGSFLYKLGISKGVILLGSKRILSLAFIFVLLTSATFPIIPIVSAQASISVDPAAAPSLSEVIVKISNFFEPKVADNWKKDEPWTTPSIPVAIAKLDKNGVITLAYNLGSVWDKGSQSYTIWEPEGKTVWSKRCRIPLQALPGKWVIIMGGRVGYKPILQTPFSVPSEKIEEITETEEPTDNKITVGFPDWENKPFEIKITTTKGGKPFETYVSLNIDGDITETYLDYVILDNVPGIVMEPRYYKRVFYVNKDHRGNLLRTDKNGELLLSLEHLYSVVVFEKKYGEDFHPVRRDGSGNMVIRHMKMHPYLYALTLNSASGGPHGGINSIFRANIETWEVYSTEYHSKISTENSNERARSAEVQVTYDYIAKISKLNLFDTSKKVEINKISDNPEGAPIKDIWDAKVGLKLLPNQKIVIDKNVAHMEIKWIWGHRAYIKANKEKIAENKAEILVQPTNKQQEVQWVNSKFWRGMELTLKSGTFGAIFAGLIEYAVVTPDPVTKTVSTAVAVAMAVGGILFGSVAYVADQEFQWSSPDYEFYRPDSLLYINSREDGSCCYVFHGSVDVLTNVRPDELALAIPVATVVGGEKVCINDNGKVDGPESYDPNELDQEILDIVNNLQTEYEEDLSKSTLGPDAGLMAYYPFDEDFNDYSGEANHGSPQGSISFSSGEIEQAAYFDGKSWIQVPDSDSLDLSDSFSFSLWLNKEDAGTGGWSVLFSKADSTALDDSAPYAFAHSIDGFYPLVRLTQNDWHDMYSSDSWTGFNEWHMLTVTWDGRDIKFYKNGEYQDTWVWEGALPDSDSQLEIGRDQPGNVEYYKGWMDDLRIYNYALSSSQVIKLYNKQEITPPSNFDVTTGNTDKTDDKDTEDSGNSKPHDDILVNVKNYGKKSGSTVSIPVFIENAYNLGNMDLSISYNGRVLNAVGYEKGSLTEGSLVEANILDDEVFVAFTDSGGINGDGSLIYIEFEVVGDAGDSCEVSPLISAANEVDTYDSLTVQGSSGEFTVKGLIGDANGDGRITAVDALMALQMAVNRIPVDSICDMNEDGSVTSLDAALIREQALKR